MMAVKDVYKEASQKNHMFYLINYLGHVLVKEGLNKTTIFDLNEIIQLG
jgi:hypothetical protein